MSNGKFAERLTNSLAKKGITPSQLARYVGTNRQTIYKYCKGLSKPKDETVTRKISIILGVSPSWLLGITDEVQTQGSVRKEIDSLLDEMDNDQLNKLIKFIKDFM